MGLLLKINAYNITLAQYCTYTLFTTLQGDHVCAIDGPPCCEARSIAYIWAWWSCLKRSLEIEYYLLMNVEMNCCTLQHFMPTEIHAFKIGRPQEANNAIRDFQPLLQLVLVKYGFPFFFFDYFYYRHFFLFIRL